MHQDSSIREGWIHGNRTISGVTGVTKIGRTISNKGIDKVALQAIAAVDAEPHGIFGVDMTFDKYGMPNPTEINIGRFFTTVYFFTKAGLNMPEIYARIATDRNYSIEYGIINPLPDNLLWIRGMDTEPTLIQADELLSEFGV